MSQAGNTLMFVKDVQVKFIKFFRRHRKAKASKKGVGENPRHAIMGSSFAPLSNNHVPRGAGLPVSVVRSV